VSEVVYTLDQDFGIPINFYAWVGLNGFVNVINTVGGVDVNVSHPIVDDTYPDDVGTTGSAQNNFRRLYIPDGPQHLDGPTALDYVRSRHSTSDFDRSARQQQVLSALKLKLDNPNIIGELPQIANDLKGSVATSMSPTQVFELMDFARGVNQNTIRHLTLGGSLYTTSGTVKTPYGSEDAIFPKCDAIVPAINTFLHITTGKCDITVNIGNSSQVASARPGSNQGSYAVAMAATPDASMNISLADAGSFSDLFGLRGIIDLVSMVVLDSPQA
jgi:polyisoprenyl-teichoic acid--peptidoglycan teichoic acid transferase